MPPANSSLETATLASGCFWCTEAIFGHLEGVIAVTSGYAGGDLAYPSYEEVSRGTTGHAETVQITFDPQIITYETLLDVFWASHNPTTPNQQGNDIGSQYRSAIFFHNEQQRAAAEKHKQELAASGKYDQPIVTEITPFTAFYPAEKNHQEFYENNPSNRYCQLVIDPKIHKLTQDFPDQVKPGKSV